MDNRWYIIYVLLTCIRVCQMSKIVGVKGEFEILPFSVSGNLSEGMNVHWRDGNGKIVYDIINGTGKAGLEYQGRVTSFPWEYKNGNFSIKIEHLQITDGGVYTFFSTGSSQHSGTINFSVKERPEERNLTDELFAILYVLFPLLVFGFFFWYVLYVLFFLF